MILRFGAYLATLLISLILIPQVYARSTPDFRDQIRKQIGFYVGHLSDADNDLYYWALLEVYNASDLAKKIIRNRYGNTSNIYLASLIKYNRDADRFLSIYKKNHQKEYLILADYASGHLERLRGIETQDPWLKTVITILCDKRKINIPRHKLSIIDAYFDVILSDYYKRGLNTIVDGDFEKNVRAVLAINYHDSRSQFRKVTQLYPKIDFHYVPVSYLELKTYQKISIAYYVIGHYMKAIELSRDTIIPLSLIINNKHLFQNALLNYGTYLCNVGELTKAQKNYEEAYLITKETADSSNYAAITNNLALTYIKAGEINKGLRYQHEAFQYAADKNLDILPTVAKNLSFYNQKIGNWKQAYFYIKQSLKIAKEDSSDEGICYALLGLSYYYSDHERNFEKALTLINQALSLSQKTGNYQLIQTALFDKAKLLLSFHKYSEALALQDTIASRAQKMKNDKVYSSSLIYKAYLLNKLRKYDRADSVLHVFAVKELNPFDFADAVRKNNTEVNILLHHDKTDKAIQKLRGLIGQIFRRARNSTDRQSGHLMLTDDELESIHLLTDLYLEQGKKKQAIALLDQVKTLNKAAYLNNAALKSSLLGEKDLIEDRKLTDEIEQYRSELNQADSGRVIDIQNKLAAAVARKNELENRIIRIQDQKPMSITAVQHRLSSREAILYYTQFREALYSMLITHDYIRVRKIPFSDSTKSIFIDAGRSLQSNQADLTKLYRLYTTLFTGPGVKSYKRLYVIPDGLLYQIPFGILPVSPVTEKYSFGSAHYFIENHSISYYTSLQDLERTWHRRHDAFSLEFAGFGVQKFNNRYSSLSSDKMLVALPNTVREVESIDSLLPGSMRQKRLFLDTAATEAAFKKWAPQARILHIATHSEVFYDEPLFSVIYMDKKNNTDTADEDTSQNDGQIHAYELFPLHLHSDMVMLSSCESGTGSYITGSGVIGLSRAFRYAGVKSLVMNMWKVDDKAAMTISVQFYRYLKQGLPKDEALQQAKLYYLNHINSDPLKWGSYIVAGQISPLYYPGRPLRDWTFRFVIVVVVILAGYGTYRFNIK